MKRWADDIMDIAGKNEGGFYPNEGNKSKQYTKNEYTKAKICLKTINMCEI